MSEVRRDELGIRCPQCGCRHLYTTHTEPVRGGRVRRRKTCRHCGRKIVTFEGVAVMLTKPNC